MELHEPLSLLTWSGISLVAAEGLQLFWKEEHKMCPPVSSEISRVFSGEFFENVSGYYLTSK